MVGKVRSRDQRDLAIAAPKRTRTSASEQRARHSASILDVPNAAEEALVHGALEELSQSYQKAQADRVIAQRKADKKARVAAEQAETLRKDLAVQAETNLYGAKTQALRAVLEQVAEARAAEGREASSSVPGIYTAKMVAGTPQPDRTVCLCGRRREFCSEAICLNMHCVSCSTPRLGERPPWDCDCVCCNLALAWKPLRPHQCGVKGRFCKDHVDKHLLTCQQCRNKVCLLDLCETCCGSFCRRCLSEGGGDYCRRCREERIESYYANLESSSFESEDGCPEESWF